MAISFPNYSRSFDGARQAVRFWGHDRSMERSFFITTDALRLLHSNLSIEEDYLRAFDINRERIIDVATRVYGRGQRGSYNLLAADI